MSNARKLGNMTTHGLDGDFNVDPTDNTLVVDSTNNRVGIGSATPTTTLDITGTATATAFSGPLTGNVTGTTSSISNHDTDALSEGSTNLYFTNARADARAQLKIDALVDSAPGTLDTLNELASALGDDANFSTTITNSIATKLPLAGGTMTGTLTTDSISNASGNLNISSTQSITLKFDSNSDQTNRELNILHDNNTKVFTADENGDIKFYEDTGNTPKFFWDSSTESVQLGGTLNLQAQGSNVSTIGNNFVLDSGYKYLTSGAANMLYFDAAGNTMFFKASSGTAGNAVSFSETMRIDSSGNIKFGPNGEGYINGAAQNTYNSGFNVNADDFSTWINYSGYQGGTTKFRDLIIGNGKGSRVATIDGSSGNVGIGVTPSNYPAYRTIIKRDDNTAMPTSGISNEAVLALINDSTTLYSWSNLVLRAGTGDAGIAAVYQGSANNSDLILYTDGGNNGVERMRIKNNGNVGIGETDPSYKLSIKKEDDVGPSIELIQASDKKVWINNAGATGHSSGRGNRFEINGTQLGHIWLGASKVVLGSSVGDGNEVFETGPDTARAHKPIAAWTHSGTKYYTHLCTYSAYQTTGTILINTNIPGHNLSGNANMFSFRVTGFWYNSTDGGAIDIVVGAYSGEGDYYNTTLTGTYPAAWKGKVWFATNSNGKVMLILGDNGTVQKCEIAVTDFVQGYINVNPSYATGWTISATNTSYTATQRREVYTRNPGGMQIIDGTARTAIFSSSGSFTVSQSNTFTPIGSLSDFKIDIHVNVGVSDDEGGGNMNPYANGVIQRRINSGTWTTADNTGISNQGGVSCHVEMSPPRVGTNANTDTYMTQQDRYRTKNHSSTFIDRPSLTMGDTLQYRLICNLTNGNHIQVGEPVGYGADDGYMAQPFGFIVTEFTPWE